MKKLLAVFMVGTAFLASTVTAHAAGDDKGKKEKKAKEEKKGEEKKGEEKKE